MTPTQSPLLFFLQLRSYLHVIVTVILLQLALGATAQDYVIRNNTRQSLPPDTLFGEVELPANGVFWNVKINTASGLQVLKNKEVLGLKAGDLYFASIPYGKSYAIVPRILHGAIDLYFYYTGSDRLSFIPELQREFTYHPTPSFYGSLAVSQAIWSATSNFYLYDPTLNTYIKVPRSKKRFIETVAYVFKGNETIYTQINTGVCPPDQIGRIVDQYNQEAGKH